ncbi:MAG: asparagine synthetase B [Bacteroidia bacterium]|nr:asparagine synthetase B [Bacteroidia bacterium]MCO5253464.1 asparagine synthetase B [Bacteroidota bacterium]
MKRLVLLFSLAFCSLYVKAAKLLIPMDEVQKEHLKAYGVTYWVLAQGGEGKWLLNYRGGSFMFDYLKNIEKECLVRGVTYEIVPDANANAIYATIANPEVNMETVKLLKAPKIAVYSPKEKKPWDDAVTLVLTYAEIPYDIIYDDEVMNDKLALYDWLHLHHEDFTGQYGKFWANYRNMPWYKEEVRANEATAAKYGFQKVSQLKLAVSKKIRDYVLGGGFLFAMCSATDSYDIALAADGVDICESMFDGDPIDPQAQSKLNFDNTFAFQDFDLITNPYIYEFSSIDVQPNERQGIREENDFFTLFEFSAKYDVIPTILTQDHTRTIKAFYGQTTAFKSKYVKPNVTILGENTSLGEARYIHGTMGKGTWTFYGGHDPEDYQHYVGEPPTELSLHPNSPGYRLILNNILFPSAKKKEIKT